MKDFKIDMEKLGVMLFSWLINSFILAFLWNTCLVDSLNIVRPITFIQALGLTILSSVIFKKGFQLLIKEA
jgi:hypothetical protein